MNKKVVLGLDLGQQNDYSVLSAVELDLSISKDSRAIYQIPYIKRYPLKTNYSFIVDDVFNIVDKFGLNKDALLVVDYTGVGRPVVDLFRERGAKPLALTITGGNKSHWPSKIEANVPKREIVSYLQIVLQSGRLKIAKELSLINKLVDEFLSFKLKIVDSGNTIKSIMEGSYGINDDIVMSIGIAIWAGEYFTRRSLFAIGGN